MRFSTLLLSSVAVTGANAFGLNPLNQVPRISSKLFAKTSEEDSVGWKEQVGRIFATGMVTASLWASPAAVQNIPFVNQASTAIFQSSVANAKQMASASGSRVNKDPDSLLRYGLPINSKEVSLQL